MQLRRAVMLIIVLAVGGIRSAAAMEPPGPDTLSLTAEEQRLVARGKRVFLDVSDTQGARLPAVVFRVDADAATVWRTIGAFESYPEWVDGVRRADVYSREGANVNVAFEVQHWLIGTLRYSIEHSYHWPDASWGTFELDDARPNDLESASGFWRTYDVADDPNATDVLYAAQLVPAGGTARLFRGRFAKAGLRSATEWVRREATSAN